MKPIAELKEHLKSHPEIRYTETEHSIEIPAIDENGFDIVLLDEGFRCTVYFDGWHDHFDAPDEAVSCVGFGLSDRCRLNVTMRGDFPQKWTVEYVEGGQWVEDSTTSLIFFPFWRPKTVVCLQNNVLREAATTKRRPAEEPPAVAGQAQ